MVVDDDEVPFEVNVGSGVEQLKEPYVKYAKLLSARLERGKWNRADGAKLVHASSRKRISTHVPKTMSYVSLRSCRVESHS